MGELRVAAQGEQMGLGERLQRWTQMGQGEASEWGVSQQGPGPQVPGDLFPGAWL